MTVAEEGSIRIFSFVPEQDHGFAHVIITDRQYPIDPGADHVEIADSNNRPESVRDGIGRKLIDDFPLLQAGHGIRCSLRFNGINLNAPAPTAMAVPLTRPPPPSGVIICSSVGISCSSSRAAVPCPAMMRASSYG